MRHNVHWQQDTSDIGSDDNSFTDFLRNYPCNIEPVGGQESYRGKQLEATVTHVITGRRVQGAQPTMRLYEPVDERYFNIVRILDIRGRRHDIEIHATEAVA